MGFDLRPACGDAVMLTDRFATTADKLDSLAKEARDDGREIEEMFLESAAQGIRNAIVEQQQKEAAA